jgi:serine/threonine-protein kinase HipA
LTRTHQLTVIDDCWDDVCEQANLNETDRMLLWGRQFLNPFAFDDLSGKNISTKKLADEIREKKTY